MDPSRHTLDFAFLGVGLDLYHRFIVQKPEDPYCIGLIPTVEDKRLLPA